MIGSREEKKTRKEKSESFRSRGKMEKILQGKRQVVNVT